MVWMGDRPSKAATRGQKSAPSTPVRVAMTLMKARALRGMPSSVLANSTAVPDTVASASESRNQASRKRVRSRRRRAR